ncbi:MAG: tetratricopeptide repeat protein, partial [Bacteroidales bacterium]|nr:tetratricopeptide repeat protein [Bacteroidales bacterium]
MKLYMLLSRCLLVATLALTTSLAANAQKERKYIRDSFKLYNDSDYVGAQEASVKALAEAPGSYEAAYNYADALFKQNKIDTAQVLFEKLAATEKDPERLSQLYHNIGNCHYVKQEYDKSIEAYKSSLRNAPQNDMTRYNLVAAQKMRDQNQNQQQQQQQ